MWNFSLVYAAVLIPSLRFFFFKCWLRPWHRLDLQRDPGRGRILQHLHHCHNCWLKPSYSCEAADLQTPWAVDLQPNHKGMSNMAISQAGDENSWSIAYLQQFPTIVIKPYGSCKVCTFFGVDFNSLATILKKYERRLLTGWNSCLCLDYIMLCISLISFN